MSAQNLIKRKQAIIDRYRSLIPHVRMDCGQCPAYGYCAKLPDALRKCEPVLYEWAEMIDKEDNNG